MFLDRLLLKGYKKTLEYADLWKLSFRDKTNRLVNIFHKSWMKSKNISLVFTTYPFRFYSCNLYPPVWIVSPKYGHIYIIIYIIIRRLPANLNPHKRKSPHSSTSYSTFTDVKYARVDDKEDDSIPAGESDHTLEDSTTWKTNSSLVKAILRAFGGYYMCIGLFAILNTVFSFLRPVLME